MQSWKSSAESPLSHVRSGLDFHGGNSITVLKPGLYFVYCQMLYNPSSASASASSASGKPLSAAMGLVSSYVLSNSLSYPASSGILLKSRHTRHDPAADRHSSYVGGLFFLHTGDRLFVRVSVPSLVSHDDKASFFGLFQVGQ